MNETTIRATNNYPFLTKAQIKERVNSDFQFACHAMIVLLDRQTTYEQQTESTLNRNRAGFMSSHAVNGTRIARKIRAGEVLTDDDAVKVMAIAPRYTRQLAEHFRQQTMESNPELREVASVFGV